MKIYVIIVTYNAMRNSWIDRCISSLRVSTVPVEIIIVDNDSIDGTREYVPASFPEVIWMPQEKNLGFGQGNNVGIRYALDHRADYVLLLNQDAFLQPTAVEEMLKVSDGRNLVSPLHLNGDGTRIDKMFRESLKSVDNQLFDDLLIKGATQPAYQVGEVCAACWFMPIDLIKKVGGFNPIFHQYGEDNNYYTRLVYHQRQVLIVPKAKVWHDRAVHGNQKLFLTKEIWIRLMVIACDPGLTSMKRIRKYVLLVMQRPKAVLSNFLYVASHYNRVIKSRNIERRVGPTWL